MKDKLPAYTVFVSIIAAIGGLLFGYQTAVVSGALLFLEGHFDLTTLQQQLVVSTLLIGALIAAILGGSFADHFGRKTSLLVTSLLFLVGTYLLTGANSVLEILTGRFIIGLGIGLASLVVPLYIAEMSPAKHRGMLVSFNQFAITIGILLAYIINYYFSSSQDWRWMFGFAFIPAVLQLIGLYFISDTPSWFISHGKKAKAMEVLEKTRRPKKEEEVLQKTNISRKEGRIKELFNTKVKAPFLVGIGISVFQQITGINIVIYYAPRIFQLAGFATAESAISATLSIGIINVLMTIVALWLIDRLGRRPLLIIGIAGMAASLAVLGWSFLIELEGISYIAVGSVMVYVSFFAISLGPIAWLIISEIFPLKIRGRAMGIAVFANWSANYIVSLTFLTLVEILGTGFTFWFYTTICLLALWFVIRKVPETKGKTLEQIQNFWE
ncbi:MAG: MFS transporter [Chlamydiae bacterium CG10_big_fil_rev_8_21_14_0_10_35_9]|nr:MAG: MFS transporter [Chlamydiae bacterium CG10_big_fil_rev_8_21_14_0_10_35_9]